MKKLIIPIVSLVAILLITSFVANSSKSELVYVDVNKLMEGYKRTKVDKEAFDKKANTLKSNVDSLMTSWQNELKKYEKERSQLSKKELELSQQLLQNKQQQIGNYQEAIQKQIQEENHKMTQTIVNDINDYVKEYGKKHGYPIIFGASGSGNIMYAEDTADLTNEILNGLNTQYNGR